MTLKEYNKKRDFSKTSEPSGTSSVESKLEIHEFQSKKLKFVIHEHHAKNLHWDLRLESEGVLRSWAVPKEPPIVKGIKRLAVQVEDHPMSYGKFQGVIPEGNYGAGTVKIWDKGTYQIKNWDNKLIEIKMAGKKLKGMYVLVKTNFGRGENQKAKSWLFFKI